MRKTFGLSYYLTVVLVAVILLSLWYIFLLFWRTNPTPVTQIGIAPSETKIIEHRRSMPVNAGSTSYVSNNYSVNPFTAYDNQIFQYPAYGYQSQYPAYGNQTFQTSVYGPQTQAPAYANQASQAPAYGNQTPQSPAYGYQSQTPVYGYQISQAPVYGSLAPQGSYNNPAYALPGVQTTPAGGPYYNAPSVQTAPSSAPNVQTVPSNGLTAPYVQTGASGR